MCLDPFGFDFNNDGDVDFYESYLTYRIMEDAIAEEESTALSGIDDFDDFGDETFGDFGDEGLESFVDEDFEDLDDLWSGDE
ncbi:MAG: hypothetical protein ACI4J4_09365 [Ruminiclostridium sp.]